MKKVLLALALLCAAMPAHSAKVWITDKSIKNYSTWNDGNNAVVELTLIANPGSGCSFADSPGGGVYGRFSYRAGSTNAYHDLMLATIASAKAQDRNVDLYIDVDGASNCHSTYGGMLFGVRVRNNP